MVPLNNFASMQNCLGARKIYPRGGGGGTLIFSYIRRLGPFFGGSNF